MILFPALALAQSPFDTGFTAMQTLFTGTIAKVASLIAIVIGGYQFAHGEPGAKKTLAGVAAGTGIAVMAANVLTCGLQDATRQTALARSFRMAGTPMPRYGAYDAHPAWLPAPHERRDGRNGRFPEYARQSAVQLR
jgi:type IV secretion system protein VirB2